MILSPCGGHNWLLVKIAMSSKRNSEGDFIRTVNGRECVVKIFCRCIQSCVVLGVVTAGATVVDLSIASGDLGWG